MSKWFVGQRVRLARPVKPEALGWEGFIAEIFDKEYPPGTPCIEGVSSTACDCSVLWDTMTDGIPSIQHTNQLEPILPDGQKPAEWEDTLWNPNHLYVLENDQSKELVCIE